MIWKILIAEDEAMERNILREIIEDNLSDVSVRTAADGLSAVETATLWGANLALLDIEMPGLNGIKAAAEIRAALPKCQIIFLTAYGRFDYAQEALRLQVYDYLLKPAEDADVIAAVRQALSKIIPTDGVQSFFPPLPAPATQTLGATPPAQTHLNSTPPTEAGTSAILNSAEDSPAPDKNRKLLLQVQGYLAEHYPQDISLEAVAELLDFSPYYLSKLFKSTVGISFIDYLTELRLNAAKELLADPALSAKEIGERVGYPNSNYFNKMFKKKTGFTPIEYRNSLR